MKRITLTLIVDDFWPESTIGREVKQELAGNALEAVVSHKLSLVAIETKIGTIRKPR